jgi:antitoxin YefM
MRTVNFSDARSNLKQVLDDVVADHSVTLIKRRDADDAVVISLEDYNAIEETMYLLSTPANAAHLMASIEEANSRFPGARVLGPGDFPKKATVRRKPVTPKATKASTKGHNG